MNKAQKRVLITGIDGFTGRYMAAEMKSAGYRVFGLGMFVLNQPDYYQVDLTDSAQLKKILAELKPDVVIHLAALAFVGHKDANAFYLVNLIGTRNLLEAITDSGYTPSSILLASSANVYGNASGGILNEDSITAPANDYAVSKLSMEYMARLWQERLPIVITRPFNYTGVGQADNFLLPKIIAHFKNRANKIELGNLDVWRDFSDVRALVEAYHRLLDAGVHGQTVNVCSGRTHSLREIIAMCESLTGHALQVKVNPAFVRANEVKKLCGDASKLRRLIGAWDTPPLQDTLDWMLKI